VDQSVFIAIDSIMLSFLLIKCIKLWIDDLMIVH
jgi:hypothetical protein